MSGTSIRAIRIGVAIFFFCLLSWDQGGAGEGRKLEIVASLFPQYDFARRIGGDRVAVRMMLPAGTDSHSFDPRPSEIMGMAATDLFAYTGAVMEPWAERLLQAIEDSSRGKVVDVSAGIAFMEGGDGDEDHGGEGAELPSGKHSHSLDPHIWLDPILALAMVDNLLRAMREADPDNASFYEANAESLRDDLRQLDAECRDLVAGAARRVLVFGGRFAFAFFVDRYGLECVGAYDSCGAGAEPSVKRIVEVTEFVKKNRIPVIYHEEFVEPRICIGIADATGCRIALAHSLHNLSAEEFSAGRTFIEIMRRNIAAFAGGLR